MLDAQRGTVRAHVRSAGRLGEAEQRRLTDDLRKFSGKEVILDVKESPELLGGVVVRMGDWVLDGSLQGKLRRLAAQLVEEQ
jgi:F-type H+-transporting ATPase subunit delta